VFKLRYGGTTDEAVVAAKLAELKSTVLPVYEAHLGKNQYLAGDDFSLADISHASYTQASYPGRDCAGLFAGA
jgi:glutathione S-transferase